MGRAALEVTAGATVFLYGTLCHPPLLETVLQRQVELRAGNAWRTMPFSAAQAVDGPVLVAGAWRSGVRDRSCGAFRR